MMKSSFFTIDHRLKTLAASLETEATLETIGENAASSFVTVGEKATSSLVTFGAKAEAGYFCCLALCAHTLHGQGSLALRVSTRNWARDVARLEMLEAREAAELETLLAAGVGGQAAVLAASTCG